MSRRSNAKPSAPSSEGSQASTPAPADPRVVELEAELQNLRAELERERLKALEEQDAAMRYTDMMKREQDEMRALIRRLESASRLPPSSPVRGRLVVATCLLRVHSRDGEKVTIAANAPIPDSVDLATLDPGTFIEKEV